MLEPNLAKPFACGTCYYIFLQLQCRIPEVILGSSLELDTSADAETQHAQPLW